MVVESSAYKLASRSTPMGWLAYNGRAMRSGLAQNRRRFSSRATRWHRLEWNATHLAAKSHVVQLAAYGPQTSFNIAQAFAVGELSKAHRQKLVPRGKALLLVVAPITAYTLLNSYRGRCSMSCEKTVWPSSLLIVGFTRGQQSTLSTVETAVKS
jgi:hypothetical protein